MGDWRYEFFLGKLGGGYKNIFQIFFWEGVRKFCKILGAGEHIFQNLRRCENIFCLFSVNYKSRTVFYTFSIA